MITMWLECEHSLLVSPKSILMLADREAYEEMYRYDGGYRGDQFMACPQGDGMKRIISCGHQWIVECQDCNYTRYEGLGAKLAVLVKAAKHMTTCGHCVHTYRTDLLASFRVHKPEVGLFAQLNPKPLSGQPPF